MTSSLPESIDGYIDFRRFQTQFHHKPLIHKS